MKRLLMIAAFAAAGLHAEPLPTLPGLLPEPVAQSLLHADPTVAAAHAEAGAVREDARLAEQSPYEYTVRANAQKRRVEEGPLYREWNVGLERTLRLPGKAKADRRIALAYDAESEAVYGEALHESARKLLELWLDWTAAEQARALAGASLAAARTNLDAVERRVKAGDAARLDAGLARAELAEQERAHIEAGTAAAVAWSRLHARFPGLGREHASLPEPQPVVQPAGFWRERILDQSDELKLADAARERTAGQADRAKAERWPDPTVGLYTASEFGGRERFTGVMLSVPIPGARRSHQAGKAAGVAESARQLHLAKRVELEAQVDVAVATAEGAYQAWRSAQANAAAMDENARLAARAYSLGEADLQSLLAARRLASAAARGALEARRAAVGAHGSLLVDAHLVWGLDHD